MTLCSFISVHGNIHVVFKDRKDNFVIAGEPAKTLMDWQALDHICLTQSLFKLVQATLVVF